MATTGNKGYKRTASDSIDALLAKKVKSDRAVKVDNKYKKIIETRFRSKISTDIKEDAIAECDSRFFNLHNYITSISANTDRKARYQEAKVMTDKDINKNKKQNKKTNKTKNTKNVVIKKRCRCKSGRIVEW